MCWVFVLLYRILLLYVVIPFVFPFPSSLEFVPFAIHLPTQSTSLSQLTRNHYFDATKFLTRGMMMFLPVFVLQFTKRYRNK